MPAGQPFRAPIRCHHRSIAEAYTDHTILATVESPVPLAPADFIVLSSLPATRTGGPGALPHKGASFHFPPPQASRPRPCKPLAPLRMEGSIAHCNRLSRMRKGLNAKSWENWRQKKEEQGGGVGTSQNQRANPRRGALRFPPPVTTMMASTTVWVPPHIRGNPHGSRLRGTHSTR